MNRIVRKRAFACTIFALAIITGVMAQDWKDIPVPAHAGDGMVWELQANVSDDFNYVFSPTDARSTFGDGKWYNFYHNGWDGPGTTYWKYNHVEVDGSDLLIKASRWNKSTQNNPKNNNTKMGKADAGVNAGCVTSNKRRVKYPVFVEASVSVANITLASNVWLLSADDTQEIDIIECYGGSGQGNSFFSKYIHVSHHSFIRNPFTDYQPTDKNTWWVRAGVSSWGEYCWNNGNRKYVQVGVFWKSPVHFEYFVDGELQRVLYDKAFASKVGGKWYYTYPTMSNGVLDKNNGYQNVVQYATSASYSFAKLQAASNASTVSVIDPYGYQNGNGFTKELDMIINVESQDWHVAAGRTPSDADLGNVAKNIMKVDWIRVYKPKVAEKVPVAGVEVDPKVYTAIKGDQLQLNATVLPENAVDKTVTWVSDHPEVASVTDQGLLTCHAAGEAVVTVTTTQNSKTASCAITVLDKLVKPSLAFDDELKYTDHVFVAGEAIDVTCNYHAGSGNTIVAGTDGGVKFWLREINPDWSVANDYVLVDASAIGKESGTANATISLKDVPASSEIPADNFYFLFITLQTSDGTSLDAGVYPVQINRPTAVENSTAANDVLIYPNPISNSFQIESAKELVQVMLYSLNGTCVKQEALSASSASIAAFNLEKGTYILQMLFADGSQHSQKIVKQ